MALQAHVRRERCFHGDDPDLQHPNITAVQITFTGARKDDTLTHGDSYHERDTEVGFIEAHILNKRNMHCMWTECHGFDIAHAPGAKLYKVENYLSNECFYDEKQELINAVEYVLYIEKVYLYPQFRGRGLGIRAVNEAIRALDLGEECVVLLEPGPITLPGGDESDWTGTCGWVHHAKASEDHHAEGQAVDATEKIARHWQRMGFTAWSYTDEAWLCLSTGGQQAPGDTEAIHHVTAT